MIRLVPLVAALALALGACSTTQGTAVIANSPNTIETGSSQRLLLALATDQAQLVGGPDMAVTAELRFEGELVDRIDTRWVWAIPNARGFYTATATFDRPGTWEIVLIPEAGSPTPPTPFPVVEDSPIPGIGDPAPRSETRVLDDHDLGDITTDPDPDPDLYRLTVAEAVTNGRPSVIIFATPAFCQTATCGPTLEIAKETAHSYPQVDFVHVEVFENLHAESQADLVEVAAVREWGLASEPWLFVVNADGSIAARFEGAIGPDELEEVLEQVGGGAPG